MKRSVVYYASGVVVGAVAVAGFRFVNWGDLKAADWAAWVQAVGSIGAIAGAFWIADRQSKTAIEAIKLEAGQAARDKRTSAIAIVDAAFERARVIRASIEGIDPMDAKSNLYITYDKSITEGLVRALSGIPMHEIGSSKAVASLLLFTDQFTFLDRAIEKFHAGPLKDPDVGPEIEKYWGGTPEDRKIGDDMHNRVREVLQGNILVHLNAIGGHYNDFSEALKGLD